MDTRKGTGGSEACWLMDLACRGQRRTQAGAHHRYTDAHTPRRLSILKTLVIAFRLLPFRSPSTSPSCTPLILRSPRASPASPSVRPSICPHHLHRCDLAVSVRQIDLIAASNQWSLYPDEHGDDYRVRELRVTTVLDWTSSRW